MNINDLLPLRRPLIFFDTETTGPNPAVDRICELGFLWFRPGHPEPIEWNKHINPTVPIPHEATYGNPERGYTGHGITDDMVKDAPTFAQLAPKLILGFTGCDFAGYNIKSFDLPIMQNEFARAGHAWIYNTTHIIDGYRLWQLSEARTLSNAVERFLKRKHEGAHRAIDDVRASLEVIIQQLLEWPQLPRDLHALHELSYPVDPNAIDADGKIIWKDGVATINFGKKWKGLPLARMSLRDLKWIVSPDTDFSAEVKQICRDAAQGLMPQPVLKDIK